MEKTLSPEERIRRAEEIYYRRKIQNLSNRSTRVNISNKKDFSLFKRMILQIVICIVIYLMFYMIQNTNYVFSEDVINKTSEILSYDINLSKLYEQGKEYINGFINSVGLDFVKIQESNSHLDTNDDSINSKGTDIDSTQAENIGGENSKENEDENLSEMEKDAKEILASKSLIIPLKGTITSRFGLRNPETPTVPKNHTGIDIAANQGTVFVASMEGIVEEVSSERRFRKPYKNCK